MTDLANSIVDNLLDPEEMEEFAKIAGTEVQWAASDRNTGRLMFNFRHLQADGDAYMYFYSEGQARTSVRFSVNMQQVRNNVVYKGKTTIYHLTTKGSQEEIRHRFEDFVKGPLLVLAERNKVSNQAVSYAVRQFLKQNDYKNMVKLAAPEEVEALKRRFDYAQSKGPDSYQGGTDMFDDPRAQGRETDYDYLTSEDVRFWNMLADEYDARK